MCTGTDIMDQVFRGKMDRDWDVARAVAQKAEKKGLKSVVERRMKILEPLLDEIYVGISHSSAVFDMQEV